MAIDLTTDKKDLERRINSYVRKGRLVPLTLLQHYSYILRVTGGSSSITADNG